MVLASSSCVTFDRCHFHSCTVVITAGAEAAMATCTHEAAGIALFCSGNGTKVVARSATIRHCEQGACVADAAMLEMHDATCCGPCITAIEARGDDSYLVMHGCTIKSSRHVPRYMQPAAPASPTRTPEPTAPGSSTPCSDPSSPASDCATPRTDRVASPSAAQAGSSDSNRVAGGARPPDGKQWSVCGVWGHSGARLELVRCTVRKMSWGLWLDGPATRCEVDAFRATGMRRGSILAHNSATLVHVEPSGQPLEG